MKRRSLALFLCMMMVLGTVAHAAPEGSAPGESTPADTGWEAPNTLTLELPEDYQDDLDPKPDASDPGAGTDPSEPADKVGVVVDVYLVSKAEDVPGYDAYTYTELSPTFEGQDLTLPELDTVTTEQWQEFTWQASELVLKAAQSGSPIEPDYPDVALGTMAETLDGGLYLLIPHGKGMEAAEYITTMGTGEDAHMATLANSADYTYTFQPQLVSLPEQHTALVDGEMKFDGTWNHAVTVALKPTQQPRFGNVIITKGIDYYEESEPATFVFEVTATKGTNEDGTPKEVYRNTVALTFSVGGDGKESVTLDRVPVNSQVTVREVYSGAFYTATRNEDSGELTVADDLELTLENTHGPNENRGHGIINQFTYDDEEGWTHEAVDPNAAPEA